MNRRWIVVTAQQPTAPHWWGDVIVTTAWHTISEPAVIASGAWLDVCMTMQSKMRCGECREPVESERLAGLARTGAAEDSAIFRYHLICKKCAPNEPRALALAWSWVADRLDAEGE